MLRAQAERDRRLYPRHPASEVAAWINTVRLKYGPTLSLLNVSSGGVQIEFDDFWLRPDSMVVVEIVRGGSVLSVPSRVVRCQVTGITPSVRYRGALEFKRLLPLPDASKAGAGRESDAQQAHARLVMALSRMDDPASWQSGAAGAPSPGNKVTAVGAAAMARALAMLDTPASRRAGAPLMRELAALFNEIADGIEQREPSEELMARLERRLRRVIPARSIRVTGTLAERQRHAAEAIYFDAPGTDGSGPLKILVEFAAASALQEWHFQVLKTSGHLVALINELKDRQRPADGAPGTRAAEEGQAGWNKLVVRFADGRLLKGYSLDFLPARGHFHLHQSPTAATESRVLVPLGHLKAVFFVRDFDGDPHYQEDRKTERSGHGRKVAITFLDNEVLLGVTLNYRPDGAGFFVTPCDPRSNNLRIFVSRQAVRHVKFL